MRLTSVLAGLVALFVATMLLVYVVNPSAIRTSIRAEAQEHGPLPSNDPVDGVYKANPFEFAEEGPFPRAEMDSPQHNFGQMAVGKTGTHTFVIRNTGDAPLKVARGPSSCKCTVGNLGKEEVPPGETVDIALEWTPPGQSMEFMQTATIWTSDPERKDIQLMITGQVVPDVVSYPEGAWTVTVMESMPSQFKGMILSMLQDSFEITGIETSQPWISVTSRPLDADEVKREMGKSGYELTCEVQPVMAVGRFKETITVNTTIENHERFQFEIEGTRVGPFNIVGPGWYSEIQRLRMGRVPSATGKVVKLSLFAIERDPPLEIAIESVDPPVLKTSIARKVPNAAAADRVQYVLNLEVPQGATPDRYSDDRMIHLRLTTNHPEAPLIKFDVELQID